MMQASGARQRQKSVMKQPSGEKKSGSEERSSSRFSPDVKLCVALVCLSVSLFSTWLHVQQDAKLAEIILKHERLSEESRSLHELREHMAGLSRECVLLSAPAVSQMEALEVEVARLQERFSSLAGQRQQLQLNLSALAQAVESVEQQDSSEVTSRLASIRTDVRRMAGLEGEVELLLNQTQALEEKVAQTEKLMVRRIGDLLAGSIDRVAALRSSAEKSSQRLDQVSALVHQLSAAHRDLSERILALESGQAKLLKTATFASDLKPKVFSIKQDFAVIQPKLDDLTLRIGLLAEDLMSREEERSQRQETTA
ncbi:inhibitor of nuclear factor kappa-B kinase-interacting protein isoform X2 [Carassius auratus]|uniref:Inhibitor of nuclear factor kappa-B kinase-interacting protein isoform X2 n=1 Tax=Carassius auratus TaxID=7957 RepID=A0A6P6MDT0_CARAU|nr:inhibitor of nuclear factor kappa-B kinase-interacting protein-like isoform X2 [Carassius auratus]XP_052409881.1 inhibitor of nuclear factor kappa-B kinase-interacting protein isoform X1 [Carassius gibelio]XP_052409882.1 inhibitor of nuclear factor kappa-B kinase-interacting protein isoform X1 [Carassius gibelio]XP_052409883.1 inhibitor of nuclear factor kappa-B kinase-interacting protein isoform X1 [Carassius gibelio]XP_052409885.1 inhibitor of nuclear factor kappa-B kinase-interacting prot